MKAPRSMAPTSTVLVLVVILVAVLRVHGQLDPQGFISIDCGVAEGSQYQVRGLTYVSDAGFVDAGEGINAAVRPPYVDTGLASRYLNVRYFPSVTGAGGGAATRSCYTLRPVAQGSRNLVRATFYYGNYDGRNARPAFDLHLGVNRWATVNVTSATGVYIFEAVAVSPVDFMQVCLVNTGLGTPFISGLELRPLGATMYQEATATQSLFLLSMSRRPSARFDFNRYQFKPDNSFPPFRYPDDSYDRLWQRYGRNAAWSTMNTTKEVDVSNVTSSFDKPSEILQNAATPANGATRMDFSWSSDPSLEDADADGNATTYLLILYFAELQRVPSDGLRQFDILVDNATGSDGSSQGFTPRYLSAAAVKRTVQGPGQHNVSLVATPAATLPPILNAFEIYAVKPMTEMATDDADEKAIMAIREWYALKKNWKGDPCAPRAFAWDGLNCSYPSSGAAQITDLNLSSSGLTGAVNSSFGDLKSLQRLDLSNNSLSGPVAGFLAQMPSLLFLDLSSNMLSGPVPAALLEKVQNGSLVLRMDNNVILCDNGPSTCDLEKKKRNRTLIIATVVPIAVAALLFVAGLLILHRMRNRQDTWMPNNSRFTSPQPQASLHIFENRKFTYKELKLMTANFREEIGRGGFGAVFLGYLENGNPVAVKMRSTTSSQGGKEFLAEVQHLTRVHHKNLVSLIGYCKDKKHLALVYEYMQGGSLEDCLRGEASAATPLTWHQRLKIALNSAQGLEYLHKSCQPPLIHRDVKTKNILLSADLEAKIADFGLMKAFADEFRTHVTTQPAGTLGYLDPEYYNTSQLSEKSDVYSFGVVLLELVTGQPPAVPVSDTESVHVALWVRQRLSEGDIASVADPRMGGAYDVNSVWKVAELGLKCKEQPSRERPAMTDIVAELKESLQLEVSYAMGYYSSSVSTSTIDLSTASAGLQSNGKKPSDHLGGKAALELQQQVDSESSATVGPAPR